MDEHLKARNMKVLERAAAALRGNNFKVSIFDNSAQTAASILDAVGSGKSAGLGGSMTIQALGLAERLKEAGNTVITHTPGMNPGERIKTWLAAQAADFYFASPQAITMKGEVVMLDGNGNRAAACIYGPKKVILVAGVNKLAGDFEQGLWRARNVSAVANSIRLKRDNPCVKTGKCEDCSGPQRVCNVLSVLYKKPASTDIEIFLVNEELGY